MNDHYDDDHLLETFAADLRREFSPTALPPHLPAAIQQALAPAPTGVSAVAAQASAWFAWLTFAPAAAAFAVLAGFAVFSTMPIASSRQQRVVNSSTPSSSVAAARSQTDFASSGAAPRGSTSDLEKQDSADSDTLAASDAVIQQARRDYVDTLRWRDRRTGAQLEVTYPRAEITTAAFHPL